MPYNFPISRSGGREIMTDYATIPNVAADLATVDCYVYQISVVNTSGGSVTVTLKDKASSPHTLMPPATIVNNSSYIFVWPVGTKFKGGINWVTTGASNVIGEIIGTKGSA